MLLEVDTFLGYINTFTSRKPILSNMYLRSESECQFNCLSSLKVHRRLSGVVRDSKGRPVSDAVVVVNMSSDRLTSPIAIDFTADKRPLGQGVFVIASACLMSVLFCAVFIWHIRSAKFSRIHDSIRWCRSDRESLRMEAMASEKSPLRQEFLEDSESEDDPFFVERR
ncbi:hypothetical protein IRJ41_005393 [Triplophysa rosa]|uniref:Uncharacterized protein n=1 Tax=Triplophysa rosa TaxID=992332 RepID=A0A9W7TFY7_TRIRA|nr:hypothetical protein IRJ41_005393 [Triplophysa rosa]